MYYKSVVQLPVFTGTKLTNPIHQKMWNPKKVEPCVKMVRVPELSCKFLSYCFFDLVPWKTKTFFFFGKQRRVLEQQFQYMWWFLEGCSGVVFWVWHVMNYLSLWWITQKRFWPCDVIVNLDLKTVEGDTHSLYLCVLLNRIRSRFGWCCIPD